MKESIFEFLDWLEDNLTQNSNIEKIIVDLHNGLLILIDEKNNGDVLPKRHNELLEAKSKLLNNENWKVIYKDGKKSMVFKKKDLRDLC